MKQVQEVESMIDRIETRMLRDVRMYNYLKAQIDNFRGLIATQCTEAQHESKERLKLKENIELLNTRLKETHIINRNYRITLNALDLQIFPTTGISAQVKNQAMDLQRESEEVNSSVSNILQVCMNCDKKRDDLKIFRKLGDEILGIEATVEKLDDNRLAYNKMVTNLSAELNGRVIELINSYKFYQKVRSDYEKNVELLSITKSDMMQLKALHAQYVEKYQNYKRESDKNSYSVKNDSRNNDNLVDENKENRKTEFNNKCRSNVFPHNIISNIFRKRSGFREHNHDNSANEDDDRVMFRPNEFKLGKRLKPCVNVTRTNANDGTPKQSDSREYSTAYENKHEDLLVQKKSTFVGSNSFLPFKKSLNIEKKQGLLESSIPSVSSLTKNNMFSCQNSPALSHVSGAFSNNSSGIAMCFQSYKDGDMDSGLTLFGADDTSDDQQFMFNFKAQ